MFQGFLRVYNQDSYQSLTPFLAPPISRGFLLKWMENPPRFPLWQGEIAVQVAGFPDESHRKLYQPSHSKDSKKAEEIGNSTSVLEFSCWFHS